MSKKKSKKIRPVGQITEDMEKYLFELVEDHELQRHEILGMIDYWIRYHYPDAIENYEGDENV